MIRGNLLDVNVLIALTSIEHPQYSTAQRWFDSLKEEDWGICPLTEAGYVRVVTNPASGPVMRTFLQAAAILKSFPATGLSILAVLDSWATHRPICGSHLWPPTDNRRFSLGLAIKENGVLVTFDRGFKYLAGPQFADNVLVLP